MSDTPIYLALNMSKVVLISVNLPQLVGRYMS